MAFELTPEQHAAIKSLRIIDVDGDVRSSALLRAAIVLMKRDPEFYAAVVATAREEATQEWSEPSEPSEPPVPEPTIENLAEATEEDDAAAMRTLAETYAQRRGISESVWIARFLLDTADRD
jgi:hypothetical protein